MNDAERELNLILTCDTVGVIACTIARLTGQTPYEAWRDFMRSETYRLFRNPDCFVNNWGSAQVAEAFLEEKAGCSSLFF